MKSAMAKRRSWIKPLFLISALVIGTRSSAQTALQDSDKQRLDVQSQALSLVLTAAERICVSVPLDQLSQRAELSGDAKAALSGVISKLADLGISGAGKYETTESKGVPQQQLADSIKSGNDCRRAVLDTLKSLIPGLSSSTPPVPSQLNPGPAPATRFATWTDRSPIAVPPAAIHCSCIDADMLNPQTGQWERARRGSQPGAQGSKVRMTNNCPTAVEILALRDTQPSASMIPIVQAAAGRSFAIESLNNGESVIVDPNGVGPASMNIVPIICPSQYATPVPFSCVSDARLVPGAPPGPPVICPAQGPQNSPCMCYGRQGVNFLGDVPPYP